MVITAIGAGRSASLLIFLQAGSGPPSLKLRRDSLRLAAK